MHHCSLYLHLSYLANKLIDWLIETIKVILYLRSRILTRAYSLHLVYDFRVIKRASSAVRSAISATAACASFVSFFDSVRFSNVTPIVSSVPLPFFRSVAIPLPLQVRTEMLETSFRIHRKRLERWLAVHLRQNGKNRIRSYLMRNGSYCTTAGGTGNGATDFFYVDNVILTALTEFLRNLCNGNCRTATEGWKGINCNI